MHVPLRVFQGEGIQHLFHLEHAKSRDVENLGFSTLEESGSVRPGHHSNLGGDLANVLWSPSVQADALVDDPIAHHGLGDLLEGPLGGGQLVRVFDAQLGYDLLKNRLFRCASFLFAGNGNDVAQLGTGCMLNPLEQLIAEVLDRWPLANRVCQPGRPVLSAGR